MDLKSHSSERKSPKTTTPLNHIRLKSCVQVMSVNISLVLVKRTERRINLPVGEVFKSTWS